MQVNIQVRRILWEINGWNAKMEWMEKRWFSYFISFNDSITSDWYPSQQLITKLTPTKHLSMPTLPEIKRTTRAKSSSSIRIPPSSIFVYICPRGELNLGAETRAEAANFSSCASWNSVARSVCWKFTGPLMYPNHALLYTNCEENINFH